MTKTNNQESLNHIPLNKLKVAPENVRKTNIEDRLDELKASIQSYGLLQPLLIREAEKSGHYLVVDGQRRFLAMKALVKDKTLKSTFSVKCQEINPELARELSLSANVQTQIMHPADQFEAFFDLSQDNLSIADIAARFGVSEKIVKQRLKLANISPHLIELYRQGEMSLEHLEAFTLSDDHEKQETLWSQLSAWQKNPRHIKKALTEQKIKSADDRVKLITLEAYEKAGGDIERDLFSDDVYLTDPALVEQLLNDKLNETASALEAEGWAFVEVSPRYEHEFVQQFDRVWPEPVELSAEDAKRVGAIEGEIQQIREIYKTCDNQQELDQRWDALEVEYEQLYKKREAFTDEQKTSAGAYVSYRFGDIDITYGLTEKADLTGDKKKEPKPKKEISDRLLERLSAHKTLALQDVLCNEPQIAFDLLLTEMVKVAFSDYWAFDDTCFNLKLNNPNFPKDEQLDHSHAALKRQKAFEQWEDLLQPGDISNLYDDVAALKNKQKMALMAFCFAGTLDVVQSPKAFISKRKKDMTGELEELLKLDMTDYWKPTADLYFNHISKDHILQAVKDAKGLDVANALKKLKKSDLAKAAEKRLENSDWLPDPLKIGVHKPVST